MGRPARQVQPAHVATAVRRLECSYQLAVTRQAVDRTVQDSVTLVNVLRRQVRLEADATLDVLQTGRAPQLVEDDPAILRQQFLPVVVRSQIRGVNEDVQG